MDKDTKAILDTLQDFAEKFALVATSVTEAHAAIFAIVSAVGNQLNVDHARLRADFRTALQQTAVPLTSPPPFISAILKSLDASITAKGRGMLAQRLMQMDLPPKGPQED